MTIPFSNQSVLSCFSSNSLEIFPISCKLGLIKAIPVTFFHFILFLLQGGVGKPSCKMPRLESFKYRQSSQSPPGARLSRLAVRSVTKVE